MKVIGIAGPTGSGKTTAAEYLYKRYGFEVISIGDLVREEVLDAGMKLTAENVDGVAGERIKKKGESYWLNKLINRIFRIKCGIVVIDSLRKKFDIQFLKTKFGTGLFVVLVDAVPELRFKRMSRSDEPDIPKTLDEFIANEQREKNMFNPDGIIPLIDCRIDNNGTVKEMRSQMDDMVRKFKLR